MRPDAATPEMEVVVGQHRALMHALDAEVERKRRALAERGKVSPCARGCSGCCHLRVEIGFMDALRLAAEITVQGRDDPAFRQALVDAADFADRHSIKKHLKAMRPCVLLAADGACSVYEARPSTCRLRVVVSAPHLCVDPSAVTEAIDVRGLWRSMILADLRLAEIARWPVRGTLPRMLLWALQLIEERTPPPCPTNSSSKEPPSVPSDAPSLPSTG